MAKGVVDAIVRHKANEVFEHFLKAFASSDTYKKCVRKRGKSYTLRLNSIDGGIPEYVDKNIVICGTYGWNKANAHFLFRHKKGNLIKLRGMKRKIPLKQYDRETLSGILREQQEFFIHEFIHLTDRERWTNKKAFDNTNYSYKEGLENYANTDVESNAYTQQFLYVFDCMVMKKFKRNKNYSVKDIIAFYYKSKSKIGKTEIGLALKDYNDKYRRKLLKRLYNYAEYKSLELSLIV